MIYFTRVESCLYTKGEGDSFNDTKNTICIIKLTNTYSRCVHSLHWKHTMLWKVSKDIFFWI